MSLIKKILNFLAPAMLLALSACATGLPTQVSRFQAMPAPQGQSFVIQAAKAENRGGLEFAQYADLVRHDLIALAYTEASSPRDATLVVTMDYGVDNGRERVVATARSPRRRHASKPYADGSACTRGQCPRGPYAWTAARPAPPVMPRSFRGRWRQPSPSPLLPAYAAGPRRAGLRA